MFACCGRCLLTKENPACCCLAWPSMGFSEIFSLPMTVAQQTESITKHSRTCKNPQQTLNRPRNRTSIHPNASSPIALNPGHLSQNSFPTSVKHRTPSNPHTPQSPVRKTHLSGRIHTVSSNERVYKEKPTARNTHSLSLTGVRNSASPQKTLLREKLLRKIADKSLAPSTYKSQSKSENSCRKGKQNCSAAQLSNATLFNLAMHDSTFNSALRSNPFQPPAMNNCLSENMILNALQLPNNANSENFQFDPLFFNNAARTDSISENSLHSDNKLAMKKSSSFDAFQNWINLDSVDAVSAHSGYHCVLPSPTSTALFDHKAQAIDSKLTTLDIPAPAQWNTFHSDTLFNHTAALMDTPLLFDDLMSPEFVSTPQHARKSIDKHSETGNFHSFMHSLEFGN